MRVYECAYECVNRTMAGSLPRDDAGRWSINNTPFMYCILLHYFILFLFLFFFSTTILLLLLLLHRTTYSTSPDLTSIPATLTLLLFLVPFALGGSFLRPSFQTATFSCNLPLSGLVESSDCFVQLNLQNTTLDRRLCSPEWIIPWRTPKIPHLMHMRPPNWAHPPSETTPRA